VYTCVGRGEKGVNTCVERGKEGVYTCVGRGEEVVYTFVGRGEEGGRTVDPPFLLDLLSLLCELGGLRFNSSMAKPSPATLSLI